MLLIVKIFLAVFLFPTLPLSSSSGKGDSEINQLWIDCHLSGVLPFEVFNTAILGYRKIDNVRKKGILTIIDFSKPSTEKRFYVIDIENKRLIYSCLVAHGKNSGDIYAKDFSNKLESLKSSLGFYLTGETYKGDHGYSLRLVGIEKGINDNARVREIVIHGADYVSEEFIRKYGRLGRSWGCPALPADLSKEIIDKISDGSCLFIYADDNFYRENSVFFIKG
jgi:hypothetical protein